MTVNPLKLFADSVANFRTKLEAIKDCVLDDVRKRKQGGDSKDCATTIDAEDAAAIAAMEMLTAAGIAATASSVGDDVAGAVRHGVTFATAGLPISLRLDGANEHGMASVILLAIREDQYQKHVLPALSEHPPTDYQSAVKQ